MLRFCAGFIFLLVLLFPEKVRSQCTIEGARNGCVNDIITFTIKTSSAVSSYNWNFGSYGNSSNAAPSIKVTATGTVLVTCDIVLSNNSTCKDTHLLQIHPNPIGKMEMDPSSNLCSNGNKICLKDASTKGAADIERITLLWYDGTIAKTSKPLSLICRSFLTSGTYSYNLEVADDYGCKHTSTGFVTVNPSPKVQGKYTAINYCDSIAFCFDGQSTGGSSFAYEWFKSPSNNPISTNKIYCKTLKAGESANFKCRVTNNYGCIDSYAFYGGVPIRKVHGQISGRQFCKSDILQGKGYFAASEIMSWTINGISAGNDDTLKLSYKKNGWNYVRGKQLPPCKGELYDSFFVTEVTASAIGYNVIRAKVIDTAFFLDRSVCSPGTKIYRRWSFNEPGGLPCVTNTKQKKNVNTNCNFSEDSLARHYYHRRECFVANLTIEDSVTGCFSDTTIEVFRYDYCDSLITPRVVCLGEPVRFQMSWCAWFKAGTKNKLYTDIYEPRTEFSLFPNPAKMFIYTSVGYKSPIFTRFYNDEIVWKDAGGKMAIDSTRKVGWVSDTFFNYVLVKYQPNSAFQVVPSTTCPPWNVKIRFKDSSWADPDTLYVDWGDTIEKRTGFSGNYASLDSLQHEYKKPGKYRIFVELIPRAGCRNSTVSTIGVGTEIHFSPILNCNWRNVCFTDSVYDRASGTFWSKTSGQLFWDFGNGTTGKGSRPCAKYSKTGSYKVTLKVVSIEGCTDSVSSTITLAGPVAAMKESPLIYCSEIHTFYDSSWMSGVTNGDVIKTRQWNFGDGTAELFGISPSHIYKIGGDYTVRLIIITNNGCRDTTYQKLKVLGPLVSARIISDSLGCPPLRVKLENNSKQSGNFIWQFGDPNNTIYSTHSDTSVSFTYTKAGVYFIKLIGGDSFYNPNTGSRYFCSVTYPNDTSLRVEVFPNAAADFVVPDSVCPNLVVEIKNTSPRPVKKYTWKFDGYNWNNVIFGSVYQSYSKVGNYRVGLFPELDSADKLCPDSAWKTLKVVLHETRFASDCKLSKAPSVYLKNNTPRDAHIYSWTEMNASDSTEKNIAYSRDVNLRFDLDTGKHIICLSATDSAYCLARSCSTLIVNNYIALANVFTPGNDGYNDVFKVPFGGYEGYEFLVFNRYGERIFYTNKTGEYWNGKVNNTGAALPSGTYFYQLFFQEACQSKKTMINGSITLLR